MAPLPPQDSWGQHSKGGVVLPIEVGGTVPAVIETVARYAGALLAGWLIRKGYLTGADEPLIIGLVLAAAAVGWGIYKARSNNKKLAVLEPLVADSIARKKGTRDGSDGVPPPRPSSAPPLPPDES